MRILLIANGYPTGNDPDYMVFIRGIETALQRCNCQIDRIVIAGRARTVVEKVLKYMQFFSRLLFARLDSYDCIYVHFPSHSAFPLLLRSWKKHKFVVHLHGCDLLPGRRFRSIAHVHRAITLWACRRADLVVVPSDYFRRELCRAVEPKQVHVYPSGGIDTARFRPARQIDRTTLRIGCVGHLVEGKAVDVLLRAAARLPDTPEIVIIGDGPERAALESMACELGIAQRVRFLGAVPHDRIVNRFQEFSVFVFPTRRMQESLGLVAIEAMACGVPVIGSRIGALPEYIRHGENGYLFTPGNDAELAEMIDRFYHFSNEKKEAFRSSALETAQRYDSSHVTSDLVAKFRQVVGQNASSVS